jgi:hypothetical protein
MHQYKVYDADLSGNRYDTGKIVEIKEPPMLNGYGEFITYGSIISDLFNLFGFTKYVAMYRPRRRDNDYEIVYSHNVEGAITPESNGTRVVWYLARGV